MAIDWNLRSSFDEMYSSTGEFYGRYPSNRASFRLGYFDVNFGEGQRFWAPVWAKSIGLKAGHTVILVGAAFGWSAEALISMGIDTVCTDISSYVLDNQLVSEEAELREIITTAGLDPNGWMLGPGRNADMSAPWELGPHPDGSGKLRWRARYMGALLRVNRGMIGDRTSVEIIGEDASTADSRTTLKSLKPSYSHIVTEFVIPSLTDDEVLSFCKSMEDLRVSFGLSEVYHMFNHSPKDTEIFPGDPNYDELSGLNPKLNNKSAAQWRSFLDAAGFTSHRLVSSSANEYRVT